jgi:hypothetical protein
MIGMDEWKQAADETYRAIGRFMFEFSQAEFAIRHHLALEIGLDEKHFEAVVESYDVGLLCTVAIKVFATERDEVSAKCIEKLLNDFRRLSGERNCVAHGLWVPFKDGGTVHYTSRNKLTSRKLTDQAIALEKLADDTCELRAKLENAFMNR